MKQFAILSLMVVSACVGRQLTPEEKAEFNEAISHVSVVTTITQTDAEALRELGPVKCELNIYSYGSDDPESCRSNLKYQTYKMGGTILLVEHTEKFPCTVGGPESKCIRMNGHAYAKRTKP